MQTCYLSSSISVVNRDYPLAKETGCVHAGPLLNKVGETVTKGAFSVTLGMVFVHHRPTTLLCNLKAQSQRQRPCYCGTVRLL